MKNRIYLLLDNIRSLYNIGSIMRTADAAGVEKIILAGYSGVISRGKKIYLHPKIKKTALAGADVCLEYTKNKINFIKKLQKEKFNIYSLEQCGRSKNYSKIKYNFPLCLIAGNEIQGVCKELLDRSNEVIELPMRGKGRSLNVSVAVGVALYEMIKTLE